MVLKCTSSNFRRSQFPYEKEVDGGSISSWMVEEGEWDQESSSIRIITSEKSYHRKGAGHYRKKLPKNIRYKDQENWAKEQVDC